jgi:hypothetical protein
MPAPVLFAVDADPAALGHVERELRDPYASSYGIIGTRSPDAALAILTRLSESGEEVACGRCVIGRRRPPQPAQC